MAIAALRTINVAFTGDQTYSLAFPAASNATSPGAQEIKTFTGAGDNTVTPPAGALGCTIIPPVGNAQAITLKGVAGDTGVPLHKTDPTSLGIPTSAAFVLTVAGTITGIRFIWN